MNNKKQNNEDIKTKINLLSKSFGFDVCKITKPEIPVSYTHLTLPTK